MKPTDKTRRALQIIHDHGPLAPSEFARRMWDTSHWKQHTVGQTGGSYLNMLTFHGFVEGGTITPKGLAVIEKETTG